MAAILEYQIVKNQNGFMQGSLWEKSWYVSIAIFSVSHFAIFNTRSHFGWSILCSFETTQYKNRFYTNLTQIHSAVIEILSFSCLFYFCEASRISSKKENWWLTKL